MCQIRRIWYPLFKPVAANTPGSYYVEPGPHHLSGWFAPLQPGDANYDSQTVEGWVSANGHCLARYPLQPHLWFTGELYDSMVGSGGGGCPWTTARAEFIALGGCNCSVPESEPR